MSSTLPGINHGGEIQNTFISYLNSKWKEFNRNIVDSKKYLQIDFINILDHKVDDEDLCVSIEKNRGNTKVTCNYTK